MKEELKLVFKTFMFLIALFIIIILLITPFIPYLKMKFWCKIMPVMCLSHIDVYLVVDSYTSDFLDVVEDYPDVYTELIKLVAKQYKPFSIAPFNFNSINLSAEDKKRLMQMMFGYVHEGDIKMEKLKYLIKSGNIELSVYNKRYDTSFSFGLLMNYSFSFKHGWKWKVYKITRVKNYLNYIYKTESKVIDSLNNQISKKINEKVSFRYRLISTYDYFYTKRNNLIIKVRNKTLDTINSCSIEYTCRKKEGDTLLFEDTIYINTKILPHKTYYKQLDFFPCSNMDIDNINLDMHVVSLHFTNGKELKKYRFFDERIKSIKPLEFVSDTVKVDSTQKIEKDKVYHFLKYCFNI